MITTGGSLLVLLLVFAGCASEDDSIARVGDRAITAQEVRGFIDKLPEDSRIEDLSKEQLRDHLQTIIDFELMLMEARSQGIETSAAYLTRMNRIHTFLVKKGVILAMLHASGSGPVHLAVPERRFMGGGHGGTKYVVPFYNLRNTQPI